MGKPSWTNLSSEASRASPPSAVALLRRTGVRGICGKAKRNCAEANPAFHPPKQVITEDGRTGHPGEGE